MVKSVFAAVLVVLAAGMIAAHTLHVSLLDVQTGSMAPHFKPGDAVVNVPFVAADLGVGDVVTYHSQLIPGQLVTHRVIRIDRRRQVVTTQGDRLQRADPPVFMQAIVGREVLVVPHGGTILRALKRPLGMALLLYIPMAILVMAEFRRLQRSFRRGYYLLVR